MSEDRRLLDALTVGGYRVGAVAARLTPGVAARALTVPLGATAAAASPERRAMVMRHLRRVDPSLTGLRLRRAAQEAFDSYVRYYVESFRLPSLSSRQVAAGHTEVG